MEGMEGSGKPKSQSLAMELGCGRLSDENGS